MLGEFGGGYPFPGTEKVWSLPRRSREFQKAKWLEKGPKKPNFWWSWLEV